MQWCLEHIQDLRFYELLCRFDRDLADEAKAQGCPSCEGRLDRANYPRKPRGVSKQLPPGAGIRYSLCCAVEGCRGRVTPPSLRFFGRRVYLGSVFVLVSALRQGPTRWSVSRLRRLVGVSARTLRRWLAWWRATFVGSRFWREKRGDLLPPVAEGALPWSLVVRLASAGDPGMEALAGVLRFFSPLTAGGAGRAG